MSPLWFFYIGITLIGATIYSVVVKLVGESINPFLFGVILAIAALIGHLIAAGVYYGFEGQKIFAASTPAIVYTIIAGLSIVAIDIGFFLAVKQGGLVVSQMFWMIGGLILISGISFLFLNEAFTITKGVGIALGVIALALIIKG